MSTNFELKFGEDASNEDVKSDEERSLLVKLILEMTDMDDLLYIGTVLDEQVLKIKQVEENNDKR